MKTIIKDIIKVFETKCNEEMGHISGVFMSQGDTRAGDIIMPTTELNEASDRLCLYCFEALLEIHRQGKKQREQILKAQNEKLRKISPLGTYTALELIKENEKLIDDIKN